MLNGLSTENCHKIKCNPFYDGRRSGQRCSSWCDLLAHCFSADTTEEWIRSCSRKFRKFSWDKIAVSNGNINVSIEVVPRKPFTNGLFDIKASKGKRKCEVNNLLNSPVNGRLVLQSCYVTRGTILASVAWRSSQLFRGSEKRAGELAGGVKRRGGQRRRKELLFCPPRRFTSCS